MTVFGGKITTHRRLTEQVMDKLRPFLPDMGPAWTAGLKMDDRQQKDLEDYMMSPETAKGPTNGAGADAAT